MKFFVSLLIWLWRVFCQQTEQTSIAIYLCTMPPSVTYYIYAWKQVPYINIYWRYKVYLYILWILDNSDLVCATTNYWYIHLLAIQGKQPSSFVCSCKNLIWNLIGVIIRDLIDFFSIILKYIIPWNWLKLIPFSEQTFRFL